MHAWRVRFKMKCVDNMTRSGALSKSDQGHVPNDSNAFGAVMACNILKPFRAGLRTTSVLFCGAETCERQGNVAFVDVERTMPPRYKGHAQQVTELCGSTSLETEKTCVHAFDGKWAVRVLTKQINHGRGHRGTEGHCVSTRKGLYSHSLSHSVHAYSRKLIHGTD